MCFSAYLVNQVPQLCSRKLGQLLLITISRFFCYCWLLNAKPASNSVLHKSRLYVGLGRLTYKVRLFVCRIGLFAQQLCKADWLEFSSCEPLLTPLLPGAKRFLSLDELRFLGHKGSIQVSEKLHTYPSPKLTLPLTFHLGQNFGLGEG